MVTNSDLILILSEMEANGLNVDKYLSKASLSEHVNLEVLAFINQYRPLEITNFYTMLRKNYNKKKSSLYKNIVNENFQTPDKVLVTLSALNTQIILFSNKLENNEMFLKHSRGEEITRVLNNYYKTYDLRPCFKLLKLIKADLKVFEDIIKQKDN